MLTSNLDDDDDDSLESTTGGLSSVEGEKFSVFTNRYSIGSSFL